MYMKTEFEIKELGDFNYFLRIIEVAGSKSNIFQS